MSQLPIHAVMPELLSAIERHHQVIVKAAPGAGKSTYFPLQLLLKQTVMGKIIMLEPRRLAARNIARFLAQQLGEPVGERVGYRVRGDNKVSARTQLEIVTEGVMTRMIQEDPELDGVDMLIFDEFHERSLHADTALSLSLDVQDALRDDLKLVVMSATLDHQALLSLLPEAAYIESQGRQYPVEMRYQPMGVNESLPNAMAKVIQQLMTQEQGSLLAFLPGVGAIKQVQERLAELPSTIQVCPLYGQLEIKAQLQAIEASPPGQRKVVLATNIAETSLTIEGIRMVVDSGLERAARYDLKTGITRLEQVQVAQSSAIQRTGRAGRTEEGLCVRLYSESQFKQQPAVPKPEIVQSDLSSLVMELAYWGCQEVNELRWLDMPPKAAVKQATQLLQRLGLLNQDKTLSQMGREAQRLGIEPRMAAMLLKAAQHSDGLLNAAIAAAALLEEPERQVTNLAHSLHHWKARKHAKQSLIKPRALKLAMMMNHGFELEQVSADLLGRALILAFPDRLAQRRGERSERYVLANGHGAQLMSDDPLCDSSYLVVADLMRGRQDSSQIFLALDVDPIQIEQDFPELFAWNDIVDWDENKGAVTAERRQTFGTLTLQRQRLPTPDATKVTQALLNFIRRKGLDVLHWNDAATALLTRIRCASQWLPNEDWPAMDEQSLLNELETWLEPYLVGITSVKGLQQVSLTEALNARLGWPLNQEIDHWLPVRYTLPTGTKKAIRYQENAEPVLSVRMQEVFGESDSPLIAKGSKKLVLELLSPAQRPLQVTQDLAGFWQGSYKDVQKEMKGRYPKHVWPDDPANHIATTKTKRHFNS